MAFQKVLLGRDWQLASSAHALKRETQVQAFAQSIQVLGVECVQLFNVTGMSQKLGPPQRQEMVN